MTRRATIAAFAAICVAALPACGRAESEDEVRETVEQFFRDLAHNNGKSTCARLTSRARAQAVELADFPPGTPCERALGPDGDRWPPDAQRAVLSVRVRRATVHASRAEVADADVLLDEPLRSERRPNGRPFVLRRIDGRWLIEDLG
ncbi:MAG TPA: hypothetical protein VF549_08125 [Solirubrobacteraceae bacterium]|jgi:hypothetical protein